MIGAAHLMMRQGVSQPVGLFTWGRNNSGALAQGNTTNRSSPIQVGALLTWTALSGGSSTYDGEWALFLKNDGTAWACGADTCGQLGLGITGVSYSSLVQIGAATDWDQLSTGYSSGSGVIPPNSYGGMSAGIRAGKLYTWGRNRVGEMGVGDVIKRSSPVQVGAATDWSVVVAGATMLALKTGGTLWAWGLNTYGELGLGDVAHRSSPVQVGAATDWAYIATNPYSSFAIKSTGTLWAWGNNVYGELGLGDVTSRSSPVQVGSDTDWAKVCCGRKGHTLAVKTDGALWAWGYNNAGELGLGDRTDRSSPVQVGSDTNWSAVFAGLQISLALKTNGTLWSWGSGADGALGQGNNTYYSSPAQVGSGTNWTTILYSGGMNNWNFFGAIRS